MNSLEQYISDLNPSCWLNSDHVNGYGVAQPSIGDNVNTWKDISGNGNDFYHEVVATYNPPQFGQDVLFNQTNNCISFTSSLRQTLVSGVSNTIWNDSFTLVCINKRTNGMVLQNKFAGGIQGNIQISDRVTSYIPSEQDLWAFTRTRFNVIIIKRALGIFTGQSIFSQNSYLNKSNNNIPTGSAANSAGPNDRFSLGSRRYLLSSVVYDNLLTGSIFEVIAFPRIITQSETSQVQTYLKLKYNI